MVAMKWWVPVLSTLLGGVLVMASNFALEWSRRRSEAESLALALRGEMIAIIDIVRIRRYAEHLAETVALLKQGQPVLMPPLRIEREYFPIYSENAARIGILVPEVAASLARAYTYANSFVEDATMPRDPTLSPGMAEFIEETADVLRLALKEADEAVDLIETTYMVDPWWKQAWKKLMHQASHWWDLLKN